MAPKSARVKANINADTDDNANTDKTDQYTWSGTPMDKITWFYSNRKSLLDDEPYPQPVYYADAR